MKLPNLALRTVLAVMLEPLEYDTENIPVNAEELQSDPAVVMVGNIPVQCYIIIKNQTQNDASGKCVRIDQTSIQFQITTVWPKNTGGYELAELIEQELYDILFADSNLQSSIVLPDPFKAIQSRITASPNTHYHTETSSVWIKQPILEMMISQS